MTADAPGKAGETSVVKKALAEIRALRSKVEEGDRMRREPIAIVGLGCRFPGASSPDAFWTLLHEGREAIAQVPADRWDVDAFIGAGAEAAGTIATRRGGFLDAIDRFDARFFGITPREAASMDPQQRLLLEVAWEALEHAGMPPAGLMGTSVGVFVGLAASDYLQLELRSVELADIDAYLASGSSPAVASGRLSYMLGLQGPSLTVDTACSSSLVATHLACQSLRNRECRMALAGGVSLILLPEVSVNFSRAGMLAPDGRCKTFDAAADGYVRSEGCGMVVLKRMSDARADGDRILAVIRGSAVNQDGRSSGLTAPNGPSQTAVIRDALARAGLSASDVDYIEAHGTGTSLGDPIEVGALAAVFANGRSRDRALMLGSVKTNLGHLEAAAGMAGLIKVVLSLQHAEIPPHLHLRTPNPLIPWREWPVVVPTTPVPWPPGDGPRVAGVSAFGFSGTNAHVVVEEAPAAAALEPVVERGMHVLPLSARDPEALRALAERLAGYLSSHPDLPLADVCHTAGAGRSHFSHRMAVVAADMPSAIQMVARAGAGDASGAANGVNMSAAAPDVAFLFTGQGSQYAGMARTVWEIEPVFRAAIERCEAILAPHVDRPLRSILFGEDAVRLSETMYAQPALFAVEYALVELLAILGVIPSIVMGHSLGEDVAACVAGVMSLEDALPLVALRGRLMQALPAGGEMVAIFADEDRVGGVIDRLGRAVSIAAINGPGSVTVSGESAAIRRLVADCEHDRIRTRAVPASHAFHSALMDLMLDAYERAVASIPTRTPACPLVSTLTGRMGTADQLRDPRYWRRHVREPVQFGAAIRTLWDRGCRVFIEIGPHPVLVAMGQRAAPDGGVWLLSLRQGQDDVRELLTSVAGAYAAGVDVDWTSFDRGHVTGRRVSLPTYPFQRERFWAMAERPHRLAPASQPPATVGAAWPRAVEAAARQAATGPLDLTLSSYPEKWARLDDLAVLHVVQALTRLGVFVEPGERHSAADLASRFAITPVGAGLLGRWMSVLAGRGYLRADREEFVADTPLPPVNPTAMGASMADLFAEFQAPLGYVTASGSRLVDLLTGRESPLEILFPNGSTAIADGLYRTSPMARYTNAIAHAIVAAAAVDATPDRPLRIVEIGAGTGGTTADLLPRLSRAATNYCFSDAGPLFLSKAADRFEAYPFLTFRQLDIERHPQAQGFAPHEFDVVVAANVLHATRNLHDTLDHVAWLLAPGGLLVLCEATTHPFWFDVTTGLISGWQRFEDDLRTDVPLLAPDVWARALLDHGFEAVQAFPEAGSPAEVLRQHVIVARAASSVPDAVAAAPSQAAAPPRHEGAPMSPPAPARTPRVLAALASLPDAERHERLVTLVSDVVVRVLRLDPSRPPDRAQRLMDLGVDSLMAVELRNVLTDALGLDRKLPATLIFDQPTVEAIARYVQREEIPGSMRQADSQSDPDSGGLSPVTGGSGVVAVADLEQMSDEDVEALLNKRLESL